MSFHAPFLRYFREVTHCGSVRLAARQLHISSSAVNRQILKVEDELGMPLFERSAAGMQLTPAGHLVSEHINRTLADEQRCLDGLAQMKQPGLTQLNITGQESVIAEFLPPVLVQLHARCPTTGSSFQAAGGPDLNRLLQEQGADFAIMFDPQPVPGVERLLTRQLPVGAVVSPDHPLAQREQVDIRECLDYPMILPDRSWPLRTLLDERLQRLSSPPSVLTSSNSVEFLRTMIDQRLGIGFQTAMGIERQLINGDLMLIPLNCPEPLHQQLSLCCASSKQPGEAYRLLHELLQQRLNHYADQWSR